MLLIYEYSPEIFIRLLQGLLGTCNWACHVEAWLDGMVGYYPASLKDHKYSKLILIPILFGIEKRGNRADLVEMPQ